MYQQEVFFMASKIFWTELKQDIRYGNVKHKGQKKITGWFLKGRAM